MKTLTLKQAADATEKNKTTILKAINKGTVIANKNEKGEWVVNLASLSQSYKIKPELLENNTTVSGARSTEKTTAVNTETTHEIIGLRAELTIATERLKDKEEIIKQLKDNEFDLKTEKNRFVDMLEKKDNLLTFYQEKEVEQKPVAVKKSYWGRGLVAASLIAILVIGGTIAVLSPEKLAFLSTKESQAVAAIPKTTPMINIEPAAGAPQGTAQPSLSSPQENVR